MRSDTGARLFDARAEHQVGAAGYRRIDRRSAPFFDRRNPALQHIGHNGRGFDDLFARQITGQQLVQHLGHRRIVKKAEQNGVGTPDQRW